ncbi:MAG TPA: bifunctional DNA primase/polymerase, partial [Trichocoleus sp.]
SKRPIWKTQKRYPITPRVLWKRHQDPSDLVGVRFGTYTNYAMMDVDAKSRVWERLDELRAALETIGICRTIPIRSSSSGGLHLYIPLPERVKTFSLACALKVCLESAGFAIAPGQLEIFPNVKSYSKWWMGEFTEYNGHRLPLQPGTGSCLLDDWCEQPLGDTLRAFFTWWDDCAPCQDMELLEIALQTGRQHHRKRFARKSNHPASLWREDLEYQIEQGWTSAGQTNWMLKTIACYGRVFERLEGQYLADYIERVAIACPGFEVYCQHQYEIKKRARAWATAAEKYYWPLGEEPTRQTDRYEVNETRAEDAKQRIRLAVAELRSHTFQSIREQAKAICQLAKTSQETLYKYLELWHPQKRCVTPLYDSISADLGSNSGSSSENVQPLDLSAVTGLGPFNEVCNLKTAPKNLSPGWGERGCREREGFSTDDR